MATKPVVHGYTDAAHLAQARARNQIARRYLRQIADERPGLDRLYHLLLQVANELSIQDDHLEAMEAIRREQKGEP